MKSQIISKWITDWISLRENWVFQANYLSFGVLNLITSFYSLNRFLKTWIFEASLLSYEVLNNFNSFHRLNQFAKRLTFLNKHFQLWGFSIFPSCCKDEIGSRFKKLRRFKFIYILNRFTKTLRSLSKLFDFWNYELFQFIS